MKKISLLITLIAANFINLNAQTTSPGSYCVADFDDAQGFPVADAINSVSFGTLNNASNAQFAAPHYVHYNNLSIANFNIGATYQLSVSFDVHGGAGYGVWIDYNHNNTFDANEKVSGTVGNNALNITSNTFINESVVIPATALTGSTRMRVRIVEDDMFVGTNLFNTEPCNASTSAADVMDWGETEDYTIILVNAVGVNELTQINSNILYGNIVNATLALQSNLPTQANYKIININGQEIKSGTISNAEKLINVADLSAGIYFIQLFEKGAIVGVQKFVKAEN